MVFVESQRSQSCKLVKNPVSIPLSHDVEVSILLFTYLISEFLKKKCFNIVLKLVTKQREERTQNIVWFSKINKRNSVVTIVNCSSVDHKTVTEVIILFGFYILYYKNSP